MSRESNHTCHAALCTTHVPPCNDMTSLGPHSTMRDIAAAALECGMRVTFTSAPIITRADRLTGQYGPQGLCWRWEGPWRRFSFTPVTGGRVYEGWERFFSTPVYDEDGTALWDRRYATWNALTLFDYGETPWNNPYGLEQTA